MILKNEVTSKLGSLLKFMKTFSGFKNLSTLSILLFKRFILLSKPEKIEYGLQKSGLKCSSLKTQIDSFLILKYNVKTFKSKFRSESCFVIHRLKKLRFYRGEIFCILNNINRTVKDTLYGL